MEGFLIGLFMIVVIYFIPVAIKAIFHPVKTTKLVTHIATTPIRNKKIFDYLERSLFLLEPSNIAAIIDLEHQHINKNNFMNLFLFETMKILIGSTGCHMYIDAGRFTGDEIVENVFSFIVKKDSLMNIYHKKYVDTARLMQHILDIKAVPCLDYNEFKNYIATTPFTDNLIRRFRCT